MIRLFTSGMRFISQVASCLSRSSSDPWNRMPVTPVPSLAAHSLGFSVLYVHLVTSFATRLVRNGMEEESVAWEVKEVSKKRTERKPQQRTDRSRYEQRTLRTEDSPAKDRHSSPRVSFVSRVSRSYLAHATRSVIPPSFIPFPPPFVTHPSHPKVGVRWGDEGEWKGVRNG